MDNKKARFFIYDRREVSILMLLALMVAIFAFTLGVHLGKRAGGKGIPQIATVTVEDEHKSTAEHAQPATPTDEEIQARVRAQTPAPGDLVQQATQEEVARTDIKLDAPRQVVFPPVTAEAKAAAAKSAESKKAAENLEASAPVATTAAATTVAKRYTLQIGSYPSIILAQVKVHELEDMGLKPKIKRADVKGLGIRFRVTVGVFRTRHGAEKAGQLYRSEKKFDTFIIAPIQG